MCRVREDARPGEQRADRAGQPVLADRNEARALPADGIETEQLDDAHVHQQLPGERETAPAAGTMHAIVMGLCLQCGGCVCVCLWG